MDWSGHSMYKFHPQSLQNTHLSHCLRHQWLHDPNLITSQMNNIATQRTLPRARMNGAEIVLKSTDRRSIITLFLHVQGLDNGNLTAFISRVARWNYFSNMWYFISANLKKITVYCIQNCEGGHKWRLSRVHYNCKIIVCNVNCRNNTLPTMLKTLFKI